MTIMTNGILRGWWAAVICTLRPQGWGLSRLSAPFLTSLFALALVTVGCVNQDESLGRSTGGLEGQQTLGIDLPPLLSTENVAIAANRGLNLGDRTEVRGVNGSFTSSVAMGTEGSFVNTDSKLGNLYSRGHVTLRDRARVNGSLFRASTLSTGNGAGVNGLNVSNFVFDPPSHYGWQVNIPPANQNDVRLEPDQHTTLSPGRYRTVSVKSRSSITLSAGDYFIDALEVLEPQAKLKINTAAGSVKLYVMNNVVFRGSLENVGDPSKSDLLIVMLGTSTIFVEQPYSGFLIAPNATVQFRQTNVAHNGAFFAKQIVTDGGTKIQQRPFRFADFFPPVLVIGPREVPEHEPAVGTEVPDGIVTDLGLPAGQEACDPGLVLESELNGIQSDTTINYRDEATPPKSCVVEFRTCDENEQNSEEPTLEELNEQPPLDSTCEGTTDVLPCGVDPESVTWDDEFGLCESDADCVLYGKICAKVCLKSGCEGSPDCIDPSCEEVVQKRCAKPVFTCDAQATEGPCQELRECAEPDASGSSDPNEHELTDMPPSNIDDPPADTPAPVTQGPSRPTTYDDIHNLCGEHFPAQLDAELIPEEEDRDVIAGNDKWGIIARPTTVFGASATPEALGGRANAEVSGSAGLDITVRLWGKDYVVFGASGAANFGTCRGELTGSLVLVGADIDPGFGGGAGSNNELQCAGVMESLDTRFFALRAAQSKALKVKQFKDCRGPLTTSNAAAWQSFCEHAQTQRGHLIPQDTDGFSGFPANCSNPVAMADAWPNLYEYLRNRQVQDFATLANHRKAVMDALPGSPLTFFDIDQSFTGFHFGFDYPVGPVTVSVELELTGSWGMSGDLTYSAEAAPNTTLQAQASIRPRFDTSVIVFMGIGIGPVVVGIEGELLLLNLQTPLHAGVKLHQTGVPDSRPRFYPTSAKYAFEAPPNAPAGYVPFGPMLYDWDAEWTFGAGAYLESLSGQIDLAAKIRLLFYTKKFKKKLAKWDALFTMTKAFTGTASGNGDEFLLNPATGDSTYGTFYEEIPFVDPQYIKTTAFPPPPNGCSEPDVGPCSIVQ